MNYIYDVHLNFHKNFYDFYDWNIEDKITRMRKIPVFKVSSSFLKDIKNNTIKIDKKFLIKIFNKSEKIENDICKKVKYCAIFSDGNDGIAIIFNKNSVNCQKSSLPIYEKEEIISAIKEKKEHNISYNIIKKTKVNLFETRFEIENEEYALNILNKISKEQNTNKINYIYLECFKSTPTNIKTATKDLKKEITEHNDNFYKIIDICKNIQN